MQKTLKLNQNYLFQRMYRSGKSVVSSTVVLYYHKRPRQKLNRIGITTTKKIGCAVRRNRARRVILESYRLLEPMVAPGYTFVVVARSKAADVKMQTVGDDLRRLLSKIGALQPQQNV